MQPFIYFERHASVYLNWIGKVEGKMLGLIWMPTLVLQLISVPKQGQTLGNWYIHIYINIVELTI